MSASDNPTRLVREVGPVESIRFDERRIYVALRDGREIGVPLDWDPRLLAATPEQRAKWRPIGQGYGINWPDIDEDVSIAHMLGVND